MLLFLIALYLSKFGYAYIENSIIGTPKILCKENDLSLDIVTSKPFRGNIFVKGRAKEPSCRQSYSANNSNLYSLSLGKCGMQRLRSVNPRGVNFVVTVIVSFHPAGFITKNDRAFHVKCFYMETDETVTSGINVSTIPTVELFDSLKMPTCTYSVRRDSPNGPELAFANVGEKVYHVWECSGAEMGMLVKNCVVTNGEGEKHVVLSDDGCTTDAALLGELQYDKSLMLAFAQSQAFKYADSNQLFFTCQIRLCQKTMGLCKDITPPMCDENKKRARRSHPNDKQMQTIEMDVASKELLVAGLDDPPTMDSPALCLSPYIAILLPLVLLVVFVTIVIMLRTFEKLNTVKCFKV